MAHTQQHGGTASNEFEWYGDSGIVASTHHWLFPLGVFPQLMLQSLKFLKDLPKLDEWQWMEKLGQSSVAET
ncbi:hypothetical protein C7B76_18465 [filamentous cyanobacterium CCP2]|nr:hypothetical protein C7B76_18465 [filamentous cyanobacterium CCP2]